ncbi:hypothetical protein HMPREF9012_2101 [Bacteroidetes bacterium oral taxon 272 str. F0290]|nr:hypothetical protein HMPREF9012_2101 [Bacteroidetes bacterium oral taxon 272 str. F0290]
MGLSNVSGGVRNVNDGIGNLNGAIFYRIERVQNPSNE